MNIIAQTNLMRYLLSILLLSLSLSSMAQDNKKVTVFGYITDEKSGEKLKGVTVYISENNQSTQSNVYGFYSMTVEAKKDFTINYSTIGYKSESKSINLTEDKRIDISLAIKEMREAVVKAKKKAPIQNTTQMSVNSIPMSQIKALPVFMGEVDVLKSLQLLPGVSGGTEGTAGIYVRGGGPDQNLFLLDGVPVYNVNHLGGFFSTFNADAISNVDLYKGGFPARFGGRLSSVVDVKMKEGNNKEYHAEASIGPISGKLMVEGPIKKNKGSFMVSGRRTWIDQVISPLVKAQSNGNTKAGYFFYDLNAKANYKLGDKDHLYLGGYFGRDKFYFDNKEVYDANNYGQYKGGLNWGNYTGMIRWNHLFNKKLFGNLTSTISNYDFKVFVGVENKDNGQISQVEINYLSRIRDYAIKYDVDYIPNSKHSIKTGIGLTNHTFTPSVSQMKLTVGTTNLDTVLSEQVIKANEIDAYVEDDINLSKKLKTNIGIHYSGFDVQGVYYQGIQPRFSMRYLINDNFSIKASYAKMNQFLNLLANNGIGLPTDLWVPVTKKIKPQTSHQFALGVAGTYKQDYEVSIEGYYKVMNNIIDYLDGASYLSNRGSYEDIVEMGKGESYGSEFLIQKKEGKLQGLVGYTLAWTTRQYPTINNGNKFFYVYDRRHDFKVAAVYYLNKRWTLSGDWIFNTGQWTTLPVVNINIQPNQWDINNNPFTYMNIAGVYPSRNNYNMMNNHRLDLSASNSKKTKYYTRTWSVGCYNVYGRKNPFFIYQDDNNGVTSFRQASLFGFPIPYVNLSVKF